MQTEIVDNELTGVDAVKANPQSIPLLASELDLKEATIAKWSEIPDNYVETVSRVTGLSPRVLRPDRYALYHDAEDAAGWQPIEDRPFDVWVHVWGPDFVDGDHPAEAIFHGGEWRFKYSTPDGEISRWRPLPVPPENN